MKIFYPILCIFFFLSCQDDETVIEISDESTVEIAPEGLRLKTKNGMYLEKFYYHENSFVDSIHKTYQYGTANTISEKYFYNEYNQLTQIKVVSHWPIQSESVITKIHQFIYNNQHQIIQEKIVNENNEVLSIYNYSYNAEGNLNEEGVNYINGQVNTLVTDNYQEVNFYNTNINPYFIIYPKAYKKLRLISTNDLIQKTITSSNETIEQYHILEYNAQGYKINEQIENAYLDTEDNSTYNYY